MVEARAEFLHKPHLRLTVPQALKARTALVGLGCAAFSGAVLALTFILWDWTHGAHSALEYPMAVSGWLFGTNHFTPNGYQAWPIVVGALFLLGYFAVSGIAFAALAERVYHVRTLAGGLALGAVWSFFSWMLAWYMVLPIARDGAPIGGPAGAGQVAPSWVWILGYTAFGLAAGLAYVALAQRRHAARSPAQATEHAGATHERAA